MFYFIGQFQEKQFHCIFIQNDFKRPIFVFNVKASHLDFSLGKIGNIFPKHSLRTFFQQDFCPKAYKFTSDLSCKNGRFSACKHLFIYLFIYFSSITVIIHFIHLPTEDSPRKYEILISIAHCTPTTVSNVLITVHSFL